MSREDELAVAVYHMLSTGYPPKGWRLNLRATKIEFATTFPGMMDKPRTKKIKK